MKHTRFSAPVPPSDPTELQRWLIGIADVAECAALRGNMHAETYKRQAEREGRKLIQLSRRRVGDYRYRALRLPDPLARSENSDDEA
jgi:hypothetical protein